MLAYLTLFSSLVRLSLATIQWATVPNYIMSTSRGPTKINSILNAETLSLASLSFSEFTTLRHGAYPAHQVRIKRIDGFCDPTVKSYAGYLDADHGTKHLFFYFFESRSQPDEDDVLMWINGGPGLIPVLAVNV